MPTLDRGPWRKCLHNAHYVSCEILVVTDIATFEVEVRRMVKVNAPEPIHFFVSLGLMYKQKRKVATLKQYHACFCISEAALRALRLRGSPSL
ncbi:hypothetical protein D8674_025192 [Pyrus ussuriensis x Pyrus communis]|uniref:Uncharacterized protein n=1 Tax=Pyrus ussuriensis x Pyrus communis TaxID=2448454 RepID=A0A5N5HC36_9ROSA|nr:hypothetical protein D8674_025192 [Pyrus ussuriensis x Pyrus communis]